MSEEKGTSELGILFIEDEVFILKLLSEVLKQIFSRSNIEIYPTNNGEEALKILEQDWHQIDLIITDVNHPGPKGTEICKITRKKYPKIKTFIITGSAKSVEQAKSEKISDIAFQKPFTWEDFEEALKQFFPDF